ncbi:MAG: hypothetical protein AB1540_16535 [Bdellovibrionota bacterium]
MESELRAFFEKNSLAQQAAQSIKNGREIQLVITTDGKESSYVFSREKNTNTLREGKPQNPDLTFFLPKPVAEELVAKKFNTVGQVGLHIFEKMLCNDPNQKVRAKLHVGILSLMTGGYLGVLTAGGADVAKFLATRGLGNMGKLKDAISKMRG